MSERRKRLEAIFHAASELSTPGERERYLEAACRDDAGLKREVLALLNAAVTGEELLRPLKPPSPAGVEVPLHPIIEQPGSRIGRYKLLQKIGEGGMGVVYMAEQEQPVRRKVALKIIKLGMDTRQVVARFEAERQALALMDHPHIAKVLDGGATEAGRPYFVMELVEGVPITEFCDQNHLLIEERLKLCIAVCEAIQSAHQKGIIHRDIKPSNVLVTLHHGTPHPMVIDFGVAKAIDQKLTEKTLFTNFATMIGTPAYMSPEQAEMSKLDVDTRSDIYSLGVLLYELLTGTTPFPEERLRSVAYGEMQRIIAEEEPERPSTRLRKSALSGPTGQFATRASSLATDLDWIVMKCLEKDRNRRYETANGLAADITRLLQHEPVVARPPSRLYEFQKTVRRHKVGFAAAAAVIIALAGGLLVSIWQAVQAERARKLAVLQQQRADEQTEIARAVNSFLQQDLIGQADSWSQVRGGIVADPNLTIRAALDRAAERIGERFKAQPMLEAEIRSAIGKAHNALGQFERALPQLEQACALLSKRVEANHPQLLAARSALAEAISSAGPPKIAVNILEEVLPEQRKLLGADHPDTLHTVERLIYVYRIVGMTENEFATKAISLGEETLVSRTKKYGRNHAATVKVFNWLADAYLTAGRPQEALALLQPAVPGMRETFGRAHPDVLVSTHMLARAHRAMGQSATAVALFEENLTNALATLGTNHSYIVDAMIELAFGYAANRQADKAAQMYGQALAKAKIIGSDLVELCTILAATSYLGAHQFDKAMPLVEELVAARRPLGPADSWMLENLNNLVEACRAAGYADKAMPLFEEIVRWQEQQLSAENPRLLNNLAGLALACRDAGHRERAAMLLTSAASSQLKAGQFDKAETLARECCTMLEKEIPGDRRLLAARSVLGAALVKQKKYADAETLLLSCYESLRQPSLGETRDILKHVLENLVQLYQATSRTNEATHWKQQLAKADPG